MKATKSLFISFFVLAALILALNFKRPNELPADFEFGKDFLSRFDPNLGYAHNTRFKNNSKKFWYLGFEHPELKRLENGFALTEYKADQSPLRIVVLGASSVDPYMYNGNWPFQLHQMLKTAGIPHQIYNGAVSGYSSFQILTKVIRDVVKLGKIDHVIYFGPNDFIGNKDILENHASIHPYTDYLFTYLERKFGNNSGNEIVEKVRNFFAPAESDLIQRGIASNDYVGDAVKNIKYIQAVCEVNGIVFHSVLDLYIDDDSQKIKNIQERNEDHIDEKLWKEFLQKVDRQLAGEKYYLNFQSALAGHKEIFIDPGHLTDEGNKIIAQKVLELITPKNKSRAREKSTD